MTTDEALRRIDAMQERIAECWRTIDRIHLILWDREMEQGRSEDRPSP